MPITKPAQFDLKTALANLPAQPGVYRMYDATNTLIYVGKARVLKNRVRSYFQKNAQHSPKVRTMVQHISWFDYVITHTEVEALVLEDTLIKTHQPRYNIALRDDKRYPWLAITDEPFPRLIVTRRNRHIGKKTQYFGPFTSSGTMYHVLKLLRKHFPMRQRRKPLFRDRPCMNYHLKLCPGPCQAHVSQEAYGQTVRQVALFLKGQTDTLSAELTRQMEAAADRLDFEEAARLRDRLQAVETLSQRQRVVRDDPSLNLDAVAMAEDGWIASLVVLSVRQGRVIASRPYEVSMQHGSTGEEIYASFLQQYYRDVAPEDLPAEIALQQPLEEGDVVSEWLTQRRTKKVTLLEPQRGPKMELLAMAQNNARQALEQAKLYEATRLKNDPVRALLDLQEILGLASYPERMECYDISHFQGRQTVASMVVFTDGVPDKASYRRFKIECAEGEPDDFASMHEVITRRQSHLEEWGEPDLIIIDGGKGQLSAAQRALSEQGNEHLPMISLAKRYEEVFLPGNSEPILIPHDSPSLFVLQQIRDEAHRFAITYHRTLRDKKSLATPLDDIPGLGPQRKNVLLQTYKTIKAMQAVSADELAGTLKLGPKQALALYQHLQRL